MGLYKVVLSFLIIFFYCLPTFAQEEKDSVNLVIGGYGDDNNKGIYTTTLDLISGKLSPAKLAFKAKHPTYLAISKKKIIYGAFREDNGMLAALQSKNHQFDLLNQVAIQGKDPCYISLSPNEQYIASANYNGANVSIFKLSASGEVEKSPIVIKLQGSSINPKRQKSPHPHWVKWSPYNDNVIYVIDLGSDKVMKYTLNYSTGEVSDAAVAFNSIPGSGPRHLAFHPNQKAAYIFNELSNMIDFVKIEDNGNFSLINQNSTLPKEYKEHNQGAHIVINSTGKNLYASNRGLNSIALFHLDKKGEMTLKENINTGGDWPRYFKLFEQYGFMLVANKKSNNIVVFKIKDDGNLVNTNHQITIYQPTFIDEY